MDRYSKLIFTVIAISLAALAVEHSGLFSGARAAQERQGPQKVVICDPSGTRCAQVDNYTRLVVAAVNPNNPVQ